jgi:hypothetical protein
MLFSSIVDATFVLAVFHDWQLMDGIYIVLQDVLLTQLVKSLAEECASI